MADLELTDKEKRVLAYTLLGEAAGEGREGMAAIMNVIMNRSRSGRYPENPAAVAIQANKRGVHQFSTWNTKQDGGNSPKSRFSTDSKEYKDALDIVQLAMSGSLEDSTGGATHFVSKKMFEDAKPYWWGAEAPEGEVTIGNHVFGARNPNAALAAVDQATGQIKKGATAPKMGYAVEGVTSGVRGGGSDQTSVPRPTGNLTSRSVETYRTDPATGELIFPTPASGQSSRSSQSPDLRGQDARVVARNAASADKQDRSSAARSADLVGSEARRPSVTGNLQSLTKQDRVRTRPADQVGAAARTTQPASSGKTNRARPAPAPAVRPAVTAQNRTVAQLQQEADNARLSGYRDIQSMGPSSKGAIPRPVATPKPVTKFKPSSGVTRTTAPRQEPIPAGVRPQVIVKPRETDVGKPRSTVLPAQPVRVAANNSMRLVTQVPNAGRLPSVTSPLPSGGSRRGRGRSSERTAQLGANISAKPLPNEAELSVVANPNLRKAAASALRMTPAATIAARRKAEPLGLPQPPVRPVAAVVAATVAPPRQGPTQSTNWQESTFQWTENTGLPSAIANNPRWQEPSNNHGGHSGSRWW